MGTVLCTPVKMGRATYANVYLYSCLCFPATPCTFGLASKILIKEYSEYVVKMNVSNSQHSVAVWVFRKGVADDDRYMRGWDDDDVFIELLRGWDTSTRERKP